MSSIAPLLLGKSQTSYLVQRVYSNKKLKQSHTYKWEP